MKNLCILLVAGCLSFSQANADTGYQHAKTKSQGQYLSAFWKEAEASHAFFDAFSDSAKTLVNGESGSVHIVDVVAKANGEENQALSASLDHLQATQSQK